MDDSPPTASPPRKRKQPSPSTEASITKQNTRANSKTQHTQKNNHTHTHHPPRLDVVLPAATPADFDYIEERIAAATGRERTRMPFVRAAAYRAFRTAMLYYEDDPDTTADPDDQQSKNEKDTTRPLNHRGNKTPPPPSQAQHQHPAVALNEACSIARLESTHSPTRKLVRVVVQ